MLDFSPELERLRATRGDAVVDPLIARERREVFSVHPEVRIAAWAGALLLAAAVGLFVKNHFELFDKRLIAVALVGAAAACYAWAWRRERSPVSEYIILLGALILSAAVGFIEQQFDVFGEQGQRHFLVLAVFHGVTAYAFNSKLVLSLSIAALAAWMGLERRSAFDLGTELSIRAFACAAVLLIWRYLDRGRFSRTFEHFAANLALWGGLARTQAEPLGAAVITTVVAALVIAWGFRTRAVSFVLYAFVYAVIAIDLYLIDLAHDRPEIVIFLTMLIAVPALVLIHRHFRRTAE